MGRSRQVGQAGVSARTEGVRRTTGGGAEGAAAGAAMECRPEGRLLGNHGNRDDLPGHRITSLPPGDVDASCRQVAPTAHDLDAGRRRADGTDVGFLHAVGVSRILANRPPGSVLIPPPARTAIVHGCAHAVLVIEMGSYRGRASEHS